MNKLKYTEAEAVPCGGGYCPLCRALEHTCNPEDKDTRKQLETDMREWWCVGLPGIQEKAENVINYNEAIKWLDRQVAITDAKWEDELEQLHIGYKPLVDELFEQVNELTAERDKLKELNGYHAVQYELASEDCDRLQAQVDKLADERYRYKLQCERYEVKIDKLEELARDLHADLMEYGCTPNAHRANYKPRFEALGIEVDE